MAAEDRTARPERITRLYVEGREVDLEAFYEAIRDRGGQAVVTAHPPKPLRAQEEEVGYVLTDLGRRLLAEEVGP
jgi:hypothetical protein